MILGIKKKTADIADDMAYSEVNRDKILGMEKMADGIKSFKKFWNR